jgi:hypothetical protein
MARFIFLLLLLIAIAFGVHIYLSETKPVAESPREINRDQIKIIPATEPGKSASGQAASAVIDARAEALAVRKMAETVSGAACVDFSVKPADAARAQTAFADMKVGDRVASRNVEEFTRYGVSMPASKDRKTAEALVTTLKNAGLKDVLILSDNSLSLGVFSNEETANRGYADLVKKAGTAIKNAVVVPRNPQSRETIFTLREPDTNMIARLTIMQREYVDSTVKAVTCPAGVASQTAAVAPAKN